MGYHPETLVCSFPPYPGGGMSLANHPKPWSIGRAFYRLKPWIGFDVWHIDAERPGTGQRTDDSCGWFDRRPREYADAVDYLLRDATTVHEINLIIARKVDTLDGVCPTGTALSSLRDQAPTGLAPDGLQSADATSELTQDEFCARFKAHMLKRAGRATFDDGESIADYADETAPTYWEDEGWLRNEGPEACADADMSYWGEE